MPHRGFVLTSSWSGVRRSNQIASWPVELVFISGGFYKLIFLPPNHITMETLWRKNQENSSERISHAWAPLTGKNGRCTPPAPPISASLFFPAVLIIYIENPPKKTSTEKSSEVVQLLLHIIQWLVFIFSLGTEWNKFLFWIKFLPGPGNKCQNHRNRNLQKGYHATRK